MEELIKILTGKDQIRAYELTKKIAAESEKSDKYYPLIGALVPLLSAKSSYVRTRAFILICSQTRWDKNGIIKTVLPEMLCLFNDTKPTVVRQCLNAAKEITVFLPDLCAEIKRAAEAIDLRRYRDSMVPLIEKDIAALNEIIEEIQNA